MDSGNDTFLRRYQWHLVIICGAIAIVAGLALFTDVFQTPQTDLLRWLTFLLGALVFLSALMAILSRVFKILDAMRDNSAKLEGVTAALEKISA